MPTARSGDAVEQVRARLNLVDVVRPHVRLRKQGREWVGLCPFHQEKSPSFAVNEQKQSWYCFGCQQGGDLYEFVERIEKTDFLGALRILADQAGVQLPERAPGDRQAAELRRRLLDLNRLAAQYYEYVLHQLPAGAPGRELLERRGVEEATVRRFGLGFAPGGAGFGAYVHKRGLGAGDAVQAGLVRRDGRDFFQRRLVVPIRDERGQALAFTGRTVDAAEPRKYVNTPETPAYHKGRVLFALDLARPAIDTAGHAVLMEGQFDVMVAHQAGVANAVATSGTSLTDDQVRLLKRYTDELVLCFDGDAAGRTAALRAVAAAESQGLRTRVAELGGEAKDPDEFLRSGGEWGPVLRAALPGWEYRLRAAVSGLNLARPNDLARGVERVGEVLAEIPDPAVQEEFRVLAARLLAVDEHRLRVPPPKPRMGRAAAETAAGPVPATAEVEESGPRLTGLVARLVQVLAVHPGAGPAVAAGLDPADLEADDRAAFARIEGTLGRGGLEALVAEVGSYPAEESNLIRAAWASPPGRFTEDEAGELVERLRAEARHRRISAIIGRLLEAERQGDDVAADALNRELSALRRHG